MKGKAASTSLIVSSTASIAALHALLSVMPGVWRRWSIVLEPLEGFVAGPMGGVAAAFAGALAGRILKPDAFPVENFFGFAEGIGALGAGLLAKGRWRPVAFLYAILFAAFLVHPVARVVPLWTLWDIYLAFTTLLVSGLLFKAVLNRRDPKGLPIRVGVTAFVAVELDVLFRIFMLIPLGLYRLYPIPLELMPEIFIAGAFTTPLEAGYTVVVCGVVGPAVLLALDKIGVRWPIT
ncbi:MAG: hypothetical protein QXR65_05425 [Candidatus Bathyarchaeia archaeon]|nr:hypothetical protein [Candidatus Bathyarchaeota archaeon]